MSTLTEFCDDVEKDNKIENIIFLVGKKNEN